MCSLCSFFCYRLCRCVSVAGSKLEVNADPMLCRMRCPMQEVASWIKVQLRRTPMKFKWPVAAASLKVSCLLAGIFPVARTNDSDAATFFERALHLELTPQSLARPDPSRSFLRSRVQTSWFAYCANTITGWRRVARPKLQTLLQSNTVAKLYASPESP